MVSISRGYQLSGWQISLLLSTLMLADKVGHWEVKGLIQLNAEGQSGDGNTKRLGEMEDLAYVAPSPMAQAEEDERILDVGAEALSAEENSLLHWAILHSDPDILSQTAEGVQKGQMSAGIEFTEEDLLAVKQARVREVLEEMRTPTDAELMTAAIDDIKQFPNISSVDAHRALVELEYLVEVVDNANVIGEMGGLAATFDILEWYGMGQLGAGYCPSQEDCSAFSESRLSLRRDPDQVLSQALVVIGVAASNNNKFQIEIVKSYPDFPRNLLKLLEFAALADELAQNELEVATKALYVLASLMRENSRVISIIMYQDTDGNGGSPFVPTMTLILQRGLSKSSFCSDKLGKRALTLLGDIARVGGLVMYDDEADKLVQITLRVIQDACDLDMREKAVRTIQDLLNSDPSGTLKSLYVRRSAQKIIEQGTKGLEIPSEEYQRDFENLQGQLLAHLQQ